MATQTICDACQKPVEESMRVTRVGVVVKRDYCGDCLPMISKYLVERDHLHDKIATSWQNGLSALKRRVKKDRPGLELPDD